MYIPIILGTARQGRMSERPAIWLNAELKKANIDTEIIDVRDYRIEATDNTAKIPQAIKLAEKIKKADALIIVSPEYNYSYPGELKMMMDMLFSDYKGKVVGLCGVSAGGFGGVRCIEHLKLLCVSLRMFPIREAMFFSSVQNIFTHDGKLQDDSQIPKLAKFLDELKGAIKK
jgi:NAD(P)H-dependent FMN reductase